MLYGATSAASPDRVTETEFTLHPKQLKHQGKPIKQWFQGFENQAVQGSDS
jgi:hypothetical protein